MCEHVHSTKAIVHRIKDIGQRTLDIGLEALAANVLPKFRAKIYRPAIGCMFVSYGQNVDLDHKDTVSNAHISCPTST